MSADPVTEALARMDAGDVCGFLDALDELGDRAIAEYDVRVRAWNRVTWGAAPPAALEPVVALSARDGHRREWAVGVIAPRPGTVALLALRAVDWVWEVRRAAAARLMTVPVGLLADRLPLLVRLSERDRGPELAGVLAARLGDDELRSAASRAAGPVLVYAWRQLAARDALTFDDIRRIAADPDPMVRAVAVPRLLDCRELALRYRADPVGRLAAAGLAALVTFDGEPAILAALTDPRAHLRHHARGWAAVHGVDARGVYLRVLRTEPDDDAALVGLAEIGSRADLELLHAATVDDRRRVRTAAFRVLARLDPEGALEAALAQVADSLSGRVGRAAMGVIGRAAPDADDYAVIEAAALDRGRSVSERRRALRLLRRSRWLHLATALRCRDDLGDAELSLWFGLNPALGTKPPREAWAELEPLLTPEMRRSLEFALRAAR